MLKQAIAIPNKLYFRIGEVATLLAVKPYVLRYWETEFPDIRPAKSKSGQRLYKRRDVEVLVKIRELLYGERFTINGARKRLKEVVREGRSHDESPQIPLQLPSEVKPEPSLEKTAPTPKAFSQNFDQRKILSKIKKDLEGILVTLKA